MKNTQKGNIKIIGIIIIVLVIVAVIYLISNNKSDTQSSKNATSTAQTEFDKLFPEKIGTYVVVKQQTPKIMNEPECGKIEDFPDTSKLGLKGEVCQTIEQALYRDDATGKVVFVNLSSVTKGFDVFKQLLAKMSKAEVVNGKNMYRLEQHELWWFADNKYQIVVTQEAKATASGFEYGKAMGDNEVTKYFIENYPPVAI